MYSRRDTEKCTEEILEKFFADDHYNLFIRYKIPQLISTFPKLEQCEFTPIQAVRKNEYYYYTYFKDHRLAGPAYVVDITYADPQEKLPVSIRAKIVKPGGFHMAVLAGRLYYFFKVVNKRSELYRTAVELLNKEVKADKVQKTFKVSKVASRSAGSATFSGGSEMTEEERWLREQSAHK